MTSVPVVPSACSTAAGGAPEASLDKPKGSASSRSGAVQSVERALEILRVLAFCNGMAGVRFSDVMHQTGLTKATLHRLLKTLVAKGFVERDRDTRLYFLGFQFLAFGARAANRMDLQMLARPSLERLAKLTGDTAYLLVRSGSESVCLDREEGSYPVKALTQAIGTRRPLGKGAGPTAILAALSDEEIEDVIRKNRSRLKEYPKIDIPSLRAAVAQARAQGYDESLGRVLQGMYGVAVAIRGVNNEPIGALAIHAVDERMDVDRRVKIANWLKEEADGITRSLGAQSSLPHP